MAGRGAGAPIAPPPPTNHRSVSSRQWRAVPPRAHAIETRGGGATYHKSHRRREDKPAPVGKSPRQCQPRGPRTRNRCRPRIAAPPVVSTATREQENTHEKNRTADSSHHVRVCPPAGTATANPLSPGSSRCSILLRSQKKVRANIHRLRLLFWRKVPAYPVPSTSCVLLHYFPRPLPNSDISKSRFSGDKRFALFPPPEHRSRFQFQGRLPPPCLKRPIS